MIAIGMIISVLLGFLLGFYTCTLMVMKDRKELKRIMETALEKEHKTGKWVDVSVKAGESDYRCTECGKLARNFITGLDDWWCYTAPKYCPNCGAKMEVDE